MGDSQNCIVILQRHFGEREIHTGVEIGVHRGALSTKLLAAFPELTLCMVDPWTEYAESDPYRQTGDVCSQFTSQQQQENRAAAELATKPFAGRRLIIAMPSHKAVLRIPYRKISFAFIDGSHAYADAVQDIADWWPKIEPGGLLIGHDYGHSQFTGVKQAVDEFFAREGLACGFEGSCWWIAKPFPAE
jgi:O-methyltransferase